MNRVKENKSDRKKGGFARGLNALLSGKFLTREYVQSNLPFIFFLVAMMVAYIAYGYFAENNMKEMVAAESELQELKARNLSVHAKLEQLKQQSRVAESIRDLGLVESTAPPTIIRVSESKTSESQPE